MMNSRLKFYITVACWWAVSAHGAPTSADCQALTRLATGELRIDSALIAPAAVMPPRNGSILKVAAPAHCLVKGMLNPRIGANARGFGMGFELRMPLQWNQRFLFQGGGGLDGAVNPAYGYVPLNASSAVPALTRGFAVVSTDAGHQGQRGADFGFDQQARLDYAYNAVDRVTLLAKTLIGHFYKTTPRYSYFMGCSNGGRQGMMAAQRLPAYFDGIVAGNPGFRLSRAAIAEAWDTAQFSAIAPTDEHQQPILSRALDDGDLRLVSNGVLAACDAQDGLADGMINDLKACRFDPESLSCGDNSPAQCLAPAKVRAIKAVFNGAHDSHGKALYSDWPYDAGIAAPNWRTWKLGSSPTATANALNALLGGDAMRHYFMTPARPDFDVSRFDFDRDPAATELTGRYNDAVHTVLNTFNARGGRLLIYQGVSDPVFSANDIARWYDSLESANEGTVAEWARLFMVPGMTHCGGGPSTDDFDPLSAIVDWVESARAPERLIARGVSFPEQNRPLCPYPKVARYRSGDSKDAGSFICSE